MTFLPFPLQSFWCRPSIYLKFVTFIFICWCVCAFVCVCVCILRIYISRTCWVCIILLWYLLHQGWTLSIRKQLGNSSLRKTIFLYLSEFLSPLYHLSMTQFPWNIHYSCENVYGHFPCRDLVPAAIEILSLLWVIFPRLLTT